MKHIYTLEFWKDIKGYEGLYQVSNIGQVKSLRRNKILKPAPDDKGYLTVGLHKNKKQKTFRIHRLVAEAFLPNEEELPEVDHINRDRADNRVCNLQWISHIENLRKIPAGIGASKLVQCIETGEIFESVKSAAKAFDKHPNSMSNHLRGNRKTCAGLHFKYYEVDV